MGVGNLDGDIGMGGVLSTIFLSVGDDLSAGGEGGDDDLRLFGGGESQRSFFGVTRWW